MKEIKETCVRKWCKRKRYSGGYCKKHYEIIHNIFPAKKKVRQPDGKQRRRLRHIKKINRILPTIRNKGTTPESQRKWVKKYLQRPEVKKREKERSKKYVKSHIPKRILAKMDDMKFPKKIQQAFIMDGKRLDKQLKKLNESD